MVVDRCVECPLHQLDQARQGHAGRLLDRVLRLDFNADTFQIGWDQVSAEDVLGLQILRDERRKFQIEKQDEERQRQEEEARAQRSRQR